MLVHEGYGVQDFVLGIVNDPSQFLVDKDRKLVENPKYVLHNQQDNLTMIYIILVSIAFSIIDFLPQLMLLKKYFLKN